MSEILNKYKRWRHLLLVLPDKTWDFVLSPVSDSELGDVHVVGELTDRCLISSFNFSGATSYASEVVWDGAVSSGATLHDIGLTGMDNGLILFDKDSVTDDEFVEILTGSTLAMESGDTRLWLNPVSGNTKALTYNLCGNDGYLSFKGGFLQGFYKLHGFDYETLPVHIHDAVHFELTLRPDRYITEGRTINDVHPENDGIFFYMGARSENKFAGLYGEDLSVYPDRQMDVDKPCFDYFSEDYIESLDYSGSTDDSGNTISGSTVYDSEGNEVGGIPFKTIDTDNKFIFFNCTKSGFTVNTWHEGDIVELKMDARKLPFNLFQVMNCTKNGLTAKDINDILSGRYAYDIETDTVIPVTGVTSEHGGYDLKKDLYGNAFALKRNSDGSISYRYLVLDCDEGYKIEEESTLPNMVREGEWSTINVMVRRSGGYDECGEPTEKSTIKIYIYVNGYLKLVSKPLPDFNFRQLNDEATLQEGVPYNISVGGGTQGMMESIWLRYHESFPKVLPLEENFAGTFIGDIRSFRIYNCMLHYNEIKSNYLYEKLKS